MSFLAHQKITTVRFFVYFVTFHKFTHELWQAILQQIGRKQGVFGSTDWLGSYKTASDRLQEVWLSDLFRLENEVLNRLAQNKTFGIFSAGISLDWQGSYQSQIGFGGWLTTLLPTTFGLSGDLARFAIYSVPAAISAWIVTVIARALESNFSIRNWMVFAFLLTQPWLIAFGTWPLVFGFRLLPTLFLVHVLSRGEKGWWLVCVAPALLMIPGFGSGYEFATVVIGMSLAAITYFAVKEQWRVFSTVRMTVMSFFSFVLGLGMTLGLHVLQLRLRHGSFSRGLEILTFQLSKRSGAGERSLDDPLLIESAGASLRLVTDWYLAVPVVFSPARIPILGELTIGMLLATCVMMTIYLLRSGVTESRSRQSLALGMATIVSVIGPLGWITLFRPWVYIHTHWTGVIWMFPTLPLATLFLASMLRSRASSQPVVREEAALSMSVFAVAGIATCVVVALVMAQ